MMYQIRKFNFLSLLLILSMGIFVTSCSDVQLVDVDDYTDNAIEHMQGKALGKMHCLELIFPVTIEFVDETTAEVNSYEELHETIVNFFEESGLDKNKANRPNFVYPIQVLNQESEIIDVETQDQLKDLRKECPRSGKGKGRKGKGFKCFKLVFPVTLTIDGEDVTFESKEEMRAALKAYKQEAGPDAERPTLVYPITVEHKEDGTQIEVNSKEELKELKESCKDE